MSRTKKIFVLLLFISIKLFSQTTIMASRDTLTRPMPLIGLNTNAHHSVANWKIPAFVDSTSKLNPTILRYPGGTTANYWDWKTGWFQNASTTPPEFANVKPKESIRVDEFKIGLDKSKAEGLFVVNFHHSNIQYELEGLKHASELGIPIKYVEIGNEHNLAISNQFITPSVYAKGAAIYADSIKKYYPNTKICFVGGCPPNNLAWHDSIFAYKPKIDALAFHVYLGAGNTDSLFNTKRALSIPFAQLNQRYIQSKFPSIPANVDVWVTEFNMSENLAGQIPQHVETWIHSLYVAEMIHVFLENKKITMIINHNLTNQLEFAAISPFDYHITANGVIMQLLGEVSKNKNTATRLLFNPNIQQQYGTTVFPSMIGWLFENNNEKNAFIVNLSAKSTEINLSSFMNSSFKYFQFSADSTFKVIGKNSLNKFSGNIANGIICRPYSITQVFNEEATNIETTNLLPVNFMLHQNYPNPFNPETVIQYVIPSGATESKIASSSSMSRNDIVHVVLKIYDILGREVATLVDEFQQPGIYNSTFYTQHSTFASGVYYYRLTAGSFVSFKKMVLIK